MNIKQIFEHITADNKKVISFFIPIDGSYFLLIKIDNKIEIIDNAKNLEHFFFIDIEDRNVLQKKQKVSDDALEKLKNKWLLFEKQFKWERHMLENMVFGIEDLVSNIEQFSGVKIISSGIIDNNLIKQTLTGLIQTYEPNFKYTEIYSIDMLYSHIVSLYYGLLKPHIVEKIHLFPRNEKIVKDGIYIYILRITGTTTYKIGFTKNPNDRLSSLNLTREASNQFYFVKLYRVLGALFETTLKNHFKQFALAGKRELFRFDLCPLFEIDNLYREYLRKMDIQYDYDVKKSHKSYYGRVGNFRLVDRSVFFDYFNHPTLEEQEYILNIAKKELKDKIVYDVEIDLMDTGDSGVFCEDAWCRDDRKKDLPYTVRMIFQFSKEEEIDNIDEEDTDLIDEPVNRPVLVLDCRYTEQEILETIKKIYTDLSIVSMAITSIKLDVKLTKLQTFISKSQFLKDEIKQLKSNNSTG